jgi:hypothetical protein
VGGSWLFGPVAAEEWKQAEEGSRRAHARGIVHRLIARGSRATFREVRLGRFVVVGLVPALVVACGGNVEYSSAAPGGGGAGGSGAGSAGRSSQAGRGGSGGSGGSSVDAGYDAYQDPGCPDAAPPPADMECDPLAVSTSCGPGLGCYPYVDHPYGSGCGTQTFGTTCLPISSGAQGDPCGETGSDYCAPGFVCVVGTRPGKRCAELCSLVGPDTCPAGFVCGDLDVEGYGVCG